jgi:CubicO group peptidase (beta-lactamase class C family)
MRNFSIILFISLIACEQPDSSRTVEKSDLQFATPESVGINPDSLNQIEKLVKEDMDEMKFTGAVTLIAKEGKIIYESEVGYNDSLKTKPYTKSDIFRMASMTKPIVSVAAMQLVEKGKMRLDDPVAKYIPAFDSLSVLDEFNKEDTSWTTVPVNRSPTVRHLLTHTAGVPYGFINPQVNGAILSTIDIPELASHADISIEEVANRLAKIPLMHQPGEEWMYGLNTDVLGRVVEVASGQNLGEYLNEHILDPLNMHATDFFLPDSLAHSLVDVYTVNDSGQYMNLLPQPPFYHPNFPIEGAKKHFSGGSGLSGTARDYFRFCQSMLNGGSYNGYQMLQPETVKQMLTNQIDTLNLGNGKFGYGFYLAKSEEFEPDGTYSWGGAFSTVFWIDPVNELIVIQLRQVLFSPDFNELNQQLKRVVYGALESKELKNAARL